MLTFWPTSALSSVLLPTLGLPTIAIMPQRCVALATDGAVVVAAPSMDAVLLKNASSNWSVGALTASGEGVFFMNFGF